jgi:hypothetical protein
MYYEKDYSLTLYFKYLIYHTVTTRVCSCRASRRVVVPLTRRALHPPSPPPPNPAGHHVGAGAEADG